MVVAKSTDTHHNEIVNELSFEEGLAVLDRQARHYLNMSAEEFLRAWDAGEFDADPDRREVTRVAMLIPLARRHGR